MILIQTKRDFALWLEIFGDILRMFVNEYSFHTKYFL